MTQLVRNLRPNARRMSLGLIALVAATIGLATCGSSKAASDALSSRVTCHLSVTYPESTVGNGLTFAIVFARNNAIVSCPVPTAPAVTLISATARSLDVKYVNENFGRSVTHPVTHLPPHSRGVFYLMFSARDERDGGTTYCKRFATMARFSFAHGETSVMKIATWTQDRQPLDPCSGSTVDVTPVGLNPGVTGH